MEQWQIDELARGIVEIRDSIIACYQDEAHERAYQEWYKSRYGHYDTPISCLSSDSKVPQTAESEYKATT